MPRYLVETETAGTLQLTRATRLAAQRFPEIAVEHHYTAYDEASTRDLWVCRAPSRTHLERWADAARIACRSVEKVDDTASTSAGGSNEANRTPITCPEEKTP